MEIMWVHVLVVGIWVMFGEIVSTVGFARAPKNVKLALAHPVLYHMVRQYLSFTGNLQPLF